MSTAGALVGELANRKLYGTRLQRWRRDANLTPRYAANVLGISMPKLRDLEAGRCQEPAPSLAMQIYTRTDGAVPPPASNVDAANVGSGVGASSLTLDEAPGAGGAEGTSPAPACNPVADHPAEIAPPQSAAVIDGASTPCGAPSIEITLTIGELQLPVRMGAVEAYQLATALCDAVSAFIVNPD